MRFFASLILDKYQPEVIGITGSVGKTSTKEAIYTVLKTTYRVRQNAKNYNNEIGIPLSIIGAESGGRSILKWLFVFFKALKLLFFKDNNYPRLLVLEMGADHPGDIKYLTDFVPVRVGVVTAVGPVHLEFFETVDKVAQEKGILIKSLPKNGFAILNIDDRLVYQMKDKTQARLVAYGFSEMADLRAEQLAISYQNNQRNHSNIAGISFKLIYQGTVLPILLPKVLGKHLAYTALAAAAVGLIYELNPVEIAEALRNFEPPKGRMRLISGIKNTLIIDDTYNSSPEAAKRAIEVLGEIKIESGERKFAVLGDMLELGSFSEVGHQQVGKAAAENNINFLITAGERSRDIVRGAIDSGMPRDFCFNFKDSLAAGKFLQQRINQGDIILVKGSQGMRMERIVKEIMAEPLKARELLVRQEWPWV